MPNISKILLTVVAAFVAFQSFAQQIISGKVYDPEHKPIMGASIMIDGTDIMTLSRSDGSYIITVPDEYAQNPLVIRYVGYTPRYIFSKNVTDVVFEQVVTKEFGDVLVTTQKRVQSSIEVPISLTALDRDRLDELNVSQVDELSRYVPGFNAIIQSQNKSGYSIRGVTSDGMESFFQPRISVFLNGVSSSRLQSSVIEIYDMERIEVVRGPQGTLFGRGAEIGAVHFITKRPEHRFSGQVCLNGGGYGQRGATGYLNTPMGEKFYNRFAFCYDYHDGYVDNLGGGKLNGKSTIAFRNTFGYETEDKSTLNIMIDYQGDDTPGVCFKSNKLAPEGGDTSPFTAAHLDSDNLGVKRHVVGFTAEYMRNLNSDFNITNILGVRYAYADEFFDGDGTYLRLLECEEEAHTIQFSNEFRLNWDNGSRISGFIGAGAMYESTEHTLVDKCNQKQFFPTVVAPKVQSQTEELPMIVSAGVQQGLEGFKQQLLAQYPAAYADKINYVFDSFIQAACPQIQTSLNDQMYNWFGSETWENVPDFLGETTNIVNSVLVNTLNSLMTQEPMVSQLLNGATAEQVIGQLHIDKQLSENEKFKQLSSGTTMLDDYQENQTNYTHNFETDIFADFTWNVVDNFYLTLGLRGTYEHQKTGYYSTAMTSPIVGTMIYTTSDGITYWVSDDYLSFVGRFVANYMLNKYNNIYLSFAKGRRPGTVYFNYSPDAPGSLQPEAVYSLEFGLKGNVFRNSLSYAASVYRYNWLHFQSSIAHYKSDGNIEYQTDDRGKANCLGAEVSLKYYFENFVSLFADITYSDGKFCDKDEDGTPQQFAGNSFRLCPKSAFDYGIDVVIPWRNKYFFYCRPSFSYMGKVFFEDSNDEILAQDSYSVMNATLGVKFSRNRLTYDFSLWGKNISSTQYLIDAGNAGNIIGYPTFVPGAPANFGIKASVMFK